MLETRFVQAVTLNLVVHTQANMGGTLRAAIDTTEAEHCRRPVSGEGSIDRSRLRRILLEMLKQSEQGSEFILGALKALSQPTRLRIFDVLMEGVQCSCEISERLGLAPSLISYHMRALEEAGLVQSERDEHDARWIYYSLRPVELGRLHRQLCDLVDPNRVQPRVPNCGPHSGCGCS